MSTQHRGPSGSPAPRSDWLPLDPPPVRCDDYALSALVAPLPMCIKGLGRGADPVASRQPPSQASSRTHCQSIRRTSSRISERSRQSLSCSRKARQAGRLLIVPSEIPRHFWLCSPMNDARTNPPFTVHELRHHKMGPAARSALQRPAEGGDAPAPGPYPTILPALFWQGGGVIAGRGRAALEKWTSSGAGLTGSGWAHFQLVDNFCFKARGGGGQQHDGGGRHASDDRTSEMRNTLYTATRP